MRNCLVFAIIHMSTAAGFILSYSDSEPYTLKDKNEKILKEISKEETT